MLVLACTLISLTFIGCKKESLSNVISQPGETARKSNGGGGTAQSPAVSFIYPANGAIVTGTINVQISASSSIGIKNTSLMITVGTNNCLFGNDAVAPYEYSWDTNYNCISYIPSGTQVKLRATATDNNGAISYTDIYVTKQ